MENNEWKDLGGRLQAHQSTGNVEKDFAAFLALQNENSGTTTGTTWLYARTKWFLFAGLLLLGTAALCWWVIGATGVSAMTVTDTSSTPTPAITAEQEPAAAEAAPTEPVTLTADTSEPKKEDAPTQFGALPAAAQETSRTKKFITTGRTVGMDTDNVTVSETTTSPEENSYAGEITSPDPVTEHPNAGKDPGATEEIVPGIIEAEEIEVMNDSSRTLYATVTSLPFLEVLPLPNPEISLPTSELSGLKRLPSRWQLQLEAGLSFRPFEGIGLQYVDETYYVRTGLAYRLSTRFRVGGSLSINDLRYRLPTEDAFFGRVTFEQRIPDPINAGDFSTLRLIYDTSQERMWQFSAEMAYTLTTRISVESGMGVGYISYRQELISSNILPSDPVWSGPQPVLLRRYTPTAHVAVSYAPFQHWSVVARANLAFKDLTPDAIHLNNRFETATGYQVGLRFGL